MTFGERLRQLRDDRDLTGAELGKGLGPHGKNASKQSIRDWEKGDHFPKVDQLAIICRRLGCSADYLVFGQEGGALSPLATQLGAELDLVADPKDRERVFALCRDTIRLARGTLHDPVTKVQKQG